MVMHARDVLDVLDVLAEDRIDPILAGGWGIEALLGSQHRDHDDLDIVILDDELDATLASLVAVGFEVDTDERPARVVTADAAGRRVDLGVVRSDGRGDLWALPTEPGGPDQRYPAAEITSGWIGGRPVRCLGPVLQVALHLAGTPGLHDQADLERLRVRLGLTLPSGDS